MLKFKARYVILLLLAASAFSSCISFKSEYPKTTYYRLEERPLQKVSQSVALGLLVRPFVIDSEFDTDRMVQMLTGTEAQPLHYHRWTAEPQELIAAYFTNRLQQSGFFAGGVFTPTSSVVPELSLEARISECLAKTSLQEGNLVSLKIHCTLQRNDAAGKTSIVLQKVYAQTVRRSSDGAASIAPAMSDAVSAVSDSLLADVRIIFLR